MTPLNAFGIACVLLGCAGTSVTVQASRQVLTLPRLGREMADWPVLLMLFMIGIVDIAVILTGVGVAMLEL